MPNNNIAINGMYLIQISIIVEGMIEEEEGEVEVDDNVTMYDLIVSIFRREILHI